MYKWVMGNDEEEDEGLHDLCARPRWSWGLFNGFIAEGEQIV